MRLERVEIRCDVLDDGVFCVQEGADAWCYDYRLQRQFASLSIRYDNANAPDGWFFVRQDAIARATVKELIKAGHLEIDESKFTLADGGTATLGRLVPQ
jgi:hypothetical protein